MAVIWQAFAKDTFHVKKESIMSVSIGKLKSVPRIIVWYHEACREIANGDPEGRIFLSLPHNLDSLFASYAI